MDEITKTHPQRGMMGMMRRLFDSGENETVVRRWGRWLPGPKHGVASGVTVFGNPGYARNRDGLNELLGRWPGLCSWAESRRLALSGVPEDLPLLDHEIGDHPDVMTVPVGEVGLFLGTAIINGGTGARWRVWPNGHPVIVTASGRELDVVALANRRFGTDRFLLADIYADVVGDPDS
jgi:Family of unknown function (DUF6278)